MAAKSQRAKEELPLAVHRVLGREADAPSANRFALGVRIREMVERSEESIEVSVGHDPRRISVAHELEPAVAGVSDDAAAGGHRLERGQTQRFVRRDREEEVGRLEGVCDLGLGPAVDQLEPASFGKPGAQPRQDVGTLARHDGDPKRGLGLTIPAEHVRDAHRHLRGDEPMAKELSGHVQAVRDELVAASIKQSMIGGRVRALHVDDLPPGGELIDEGCIRGAREENGIVGRAALPQLGVPEDRSTSRKPLRPLARRAGDGARMPRLGEEVGAMKTLLHSSVDPDSWQDVVQHDWLSGARFAASPAAGTSPARRRKSMRFRLSFDDGWKPGPVRVEAEPLAVHFDIHGLAISAESPGTELEQELRRDFAFFQRDTPTAPAGFTVEMRLEAPPYEELPALPASLISPRNVVYRNGTRQYLDYFGRGLATVDAARRRALIQAEDPHLVHEIGYLFLLSTIGAHLDAIRLHRVHALGVSHASRGFLLMLPSGGGKSTMALELMKRPGFLLLSEDTPLVDHRGLIHPFPLRLGIRPGHEGDIPPEYLRTVSRMEFDPKTLVDIEYVRDRLGTTVPASALLVGERNSGDVSEIVPLSSRETLQALVKNLVVGLGVYQGIEFLLESSATELLGKIGLAASRTRSAFALQSRARGYRFRLGRDRERNTRCFMDFVEQGSRDASRGTQ